MIAANLSQLLAISFVIVVILAFVWIILRVRKLESFRDGLIAHAKSGTRVKMADATLKQVWWDRYNELPDCPKKDAYKGRLIEVGEMDADGNKIKK